MGSGATTDDGSRAAPSPWRELVSGTMVAACWLPIAVIGLLHYGTEPDHAWVHNVLRRLYYLPIIVAAFRGGLRGGLVASFVVSATYLPHAFLHLGGTGHTDPAGPWEKGLELILYNAVGGIAGYLASAERRRRWQLEQALHEQRRLQKQLVRAGRLSALGELVAGVAHEIRTPLHALRGTAEIVDPLVDVTRPERRMWELHRSELERLGNIAERFQAFARPRAAEVEEVDLADVAQRLVDLLGVDARKKGVEVRVGALPSALVLADRDQLAQVGVNIGVNALRALAGHPGTILVEVCSNVSSDPVMHALRIENDGPALDEDAVERLFDPFVGSDAGGSGLGLSISQRIVELHGGFIEAANAGIGVRFSVLLPADRIG